MEMSVYIFGNTVEKKSMHQVRWKTRGKETEG